MPCMDHSPTGRALFTITLQTTISTLWKSFLFFFPQSCTLFIISQNVLNSNYLLFLNKPILLQNYLVFYLFKVNNPFSDINKFVKVPTRAKVHRVSPAYSHILASSHTTERCLRRGTQECRSNHADFSADLYETGKVFYNCLNFKLAQNSSLY